MRKLDFHVEYAATGFGAFVLYASITLILVACAVIAGQFICARRVLDDGASIEWSGEDAAASRRALWQLAALFPLGGCAGFLPRLVTFPIELYIVLHLVMVVAAWAYILNRQAVAIARAMASRDVR